MTRSVVILLRCENGLPKATMSPAGWAILDELPLDLRKRTGHGVIGSRDVYRYSSRHRRSVED